jgi:hypothetical protein
MAKLTMRRLRSIFATIPVAPRLSASNIGRLSWNHAAASDAPKRADPMVHRQLKLENPRVTRALAVI